MNSTKKGDRLEAKVLSLLKEEISQDRFFVGKDNCRIYPKKGYYSKDREKDIVFDIAIEVFLPGQDTYSLLILIECKNYSHPVPVDDVEEFYQKIQQISGGNVKGIIASTNSFQEGAFKFSKSKGLGLLRYYARSGLSWELTRSPSSLVSWSYAINEWNIARYGLTDSSYISDYFDCYCYANEQYTNSLNVFFSALSKADSNKEFNKKLSAIENRSNTNPRIVEYIEEAEIETACEDVLQKIEYNNGEVQIDQIVDLLQSEDGLRVFYEKQSIPEKSGKPILGKISFEPLEITIYSDYEESGVRQRYTLAHELGHFLLGHFTYMNGELCQANDLDMENPKEIGVKDIMRMEWQANYFASCLLLPKNVFVRDFLLLAAEKKLTNRGYGVLYLDNQRCNQDSYYTITDSLKRKYNVSRTVLKLRLKKLGLLKESFR